MKTQHKNFYAFCTILIFGMCSVSLAGHPGTNTMGGSGLILYLGAHTNVFEVNKPVLLSAVLSNYTSEIKQAAPGVHGAGFLFTVEDSNGERIPERAPHALVHYSGPLAIALPAHSATTNIFDLNRYFTLKHGRYRIHATREIGLLPSDRVSLHSRTFDIVVIDAEQASSGKK